MKLTILTTTLLLATLVGRGQSKPKRSDTANVFQNDRTMTIADWDNLPDSVKKNFATAAATSGYATSNEWRFVTPPIDTIYVITYCVNERTLKTRWFRLRAITGGTNNNWINFNGLSIYKKYLNVPKGYKAVYSIGK